MVVSKIRLSLCAAIIGYPAALWVFARTGSGLTLPKFMRHDETI
jgi:hypothetical protein